MIKLQGKLPRELYLACSGGVDSMVALDFLRRKHDVRVLHFNHGTEHGRKAEKFVVDYCREQGINYIVERVREKETIPPGASKEAWWREKRYAFFDKYDVHPIVTAHHLDDCVETYIFSCLRGFQSVIPYSRSNIIRPFLMNEKSLFETWCSDKGVPFIQDDSNDCLEHSRNRIRHEIVPEALKVNPGLKTVVRKMIKQ